MVDKKKDDEYNPGDKFADDGQGFAPLRKPQTDEERQRSRDWLDRLLENEKRQEKAPENG